MSMNNYCNPYNFWFSTFRTVHWLPPNSKHNSKCIVWKVVSSEFSVKIKIAKLKHVTKPIAEVTPTSNDYQTFWRGQYELCPFVDWNYSFVIKNVNYSLVFTLYSYIYHYFTIIFYTLNLFLIFTKFSLISLWNIVGKYIFLMISLISLTVYLQNQVCCMLKLKSCLFFIRKLTFMLTPDTKCLNSLK